MNATILHGDCIEQLRTLPADSVQCCVTSPPYWGLRDYGVAGQIGLEPTLQEWVDKMVAVFREVRRVLRPDGLCWVNLGDAYAANRAYQVHNSIGAKNHTHSKGITCPPGLKPKDLIGQPWRVAFALQADGWWLRDAVVWHKPNPMPESVTDRCTKAYEMVFMLAKSERYYWDGAAMKERAVAADIGAMDGGAQRLPDGSKANDGRNFRSARDSFKRENSKRAQPIPGQTAGTHRAQRNESSYDTFSRNKRNVWTIATEPYPEAHFATFPTELPRICILASTKPGDTVLDPFNGSGTTGAVAVSLGRNYIGCELNPEYIKLTKRRLARITIGLPLEA